MSNLHEPIFVNIIGHTAGAIIFGIFLFLFLRDRSGTVNRGSWLSVAAAGLAFLWNFGSLAVLLAIQNSSPASSFLIAGTFCCLSLLPPVLLHLSLDGQMPVLTAAGYSLAVIAVGMHCAAAITGIERYRTNALLLITVGFVVLTAVSVARVARQQDQRGRTSRVVASMCLLLFSMSFVHFGTGQPLHAWSSEAALHHGGIPLALFILMQDYRFVLLDAFLRFLANALLAAAVTVAGIQAAVALNIMEPVNTARGAILTLGICVLLILFAILRTFVQRWLTHAVFRRPNLENLLQQIRTRSDWKGETEFVDWATGRIAAFMKAERWQLISESPPGGFSDTPDIFFPVPASDAPRLKNHERYRWAEAIVPLRFSFGEVTYILLGRRQGGRRYLSEDLRVLGRLATAITEQVDRYRDSEMQKLMVQAELRALQSQINPHFLFNALNTLFGIIPREASGARRTVLNLADIFRYCLQTPEKLISLSEEMDIVRAYLEIEKLRLGSRLRVEIEVDEPVKDVKVPVLSIQPLVENAIKHGVSLSDRPGWVRVTAKRDSGVIRITVQDSGCGAGAIDVPSEKPGMRALGMGLGLANVSKRLQLCFGVESDLTFRPGPKETTVQFSVPTVHS
jgi:two-component system LytT family sensor kinase